MRAGSMITVGDGLGRQAEIAAQTNRTIHILRIRLICLFNQSTGPAGLMACYVGQRL